MNCWRHRDEVKDCCHSRSVVMSVCWQVGVRQLYVQIDVSSIWRWSALPSDVYNLCTWAHNSTELSVSVCLGNCWVQLCVPVVHADSAWLTFIAIVVNYLHSVFISCASPVSILWRECACLPACTKVSDECWCVVVCLETSTDDCILCTAIPSYLALLISRMVYLSGPALLSLSRKRVFWLFLHPVEPLLQIEQHPAKEYLLW